VRKDIPVVELNIAVEAQFSHPVHFERRSLRHLLDDCLVGHGGLEFLLRLFMSFFIVFFVSLTTNVAYEIDCAHLLLFEESIEMGNQVGNQLL
jgi:hypothetical protein